MVAIRLLLHQLYAKFGLQKDDAKAFLILLSSCIFNELLSQCHSVVQPSNTCDLDIVESDGGYYRFGGAAIASLLHGRYEKIKFAHYFKRINYQRKLRYYRG